MALRFNGTDGFLEHTSAVCTAYPFTLAVLVASDLSGSGDKCAIAQGSTTQDSWQSGTFTGSTNNKVATERVSGNTYQATRSASPDISSTVFRWMFVVFASASSRKMAFGGSTLTTDTAASSQNMANINRATIGAVRRSAGVIWHANADLAEGHWFNVELSATNMDDLVAGTVLPEAVSGWVDGWSLETYSGGGTYTSLGGSRTMTASGGVTASSLSHPITRSGGGSGSTATAAAGAATVSAAGASTAATTATAAAGVATVSGTAGTLVLLTSSVFKNNTGTVWASLTNVTAWVYNPTTGALVVKLTAQTTNGSGVCVLEDALVVTGTTYRVVFRDETSGAEGMETLTAS